MNGTVYQIPAYLESQSFCIRRFQPEDANALYRVYSDKRALPYFNSDNCDGDNFYSQTPEKMAEVLQFWTMAYEKEWFARLSVIDKRARCVIGTVELCKRVSEDAFNGMGILRVDVESAYETAESLTEILELLTPAMYDLVGCDCMIIKAPLYAIDRREALEKAGFHPSEQLLQGKNGLVYGDYWQRERT